MNQKKTQELVVIFLIGLLAIYVFQHPAGTSTQSSTTVQTTAGGQSLNEGPCSVIISTSGTDVNAESCGTGATISSVTNGHADTVLDAAIAALPQGGNIEFMPGGYTFYSQVTITQESVYIQGDAQGYNLQTGPGVTFYPGSSGMGYILEFYGATEGGVSNVLLRAHGADNQGGLWLHDAAHIVVDDSDFWGDGWTYGIAITSDASVPPSGNCCSIWDYVTDSTITNVDAGATGLYVTGTSGHNTGSNFFTGLNIQGSNEAGTGISISGEAVNNFFYGLDVESLALGVSDGGAGTYVSGFHAEGNAHDYTFTSASSGGLITGGEDSDGISAFSWAGTLDQITGVEYINPVGVISDPIGTAYLSGSNSIGLGGTSATIVGDTAYKIVGVPIELACSGGSGITLLEYDNSNNQVEAVSESGSFNTGFMPVGYTIQLDYASAPACVVSGD